MMTQTFNEVDTTIDRIKLPISFDVAKMTEEVQALHFNEFLYYNVIPLSSPAHFVDPSLPVPPPADDYADGSWTDWLDNRHLKIPPI